MWERRKWLHGGKLLLVTSLLLGQVKDTVPLVIYAATTNIADQNAVIEGGVEVLPGSEIENTTEEIPQKPEDSGNTGEEVTPEPEEGGNTGEGVLPDPEEGGNTGEGVTPAPEEDGNTGEGVTPAPEEDGNTGEEVTPAPEEDGNTGEEVTPEPEEGGNTGEEVTPAPEEGENTGEEVLPEPEEGGNIGEEVLPEPEEDGSTGEEELDSEEDELIDLNEEGIPSPYSTLLPKAEGSGLVQLWQTVPSGQGTKEGVSDSAVSEALTCKPNHTLYASGQSNHDTYVNSCYVDDALFLGVEGDYYKLYVSGYEGKVKREQSHTFKLDLNNDGKKVDYTINTVAYFIPASTTMYLESDTATQQGSNVLNSSVETLNKHSVETQKTIDLMSNWVVKSPSYYANENGTLVHYLTNNVRGTSYSKTIVGKAPSWMAAKTRYYSYDGIYFYSDWKNIKVNGSGALNANNPFYNYYQWLPFRSATNYGPSHINSFISDAGYTKFANAYPPKSNESALVESGILFHNVQDKYGINAGLQFAMGIHESGWGRSSLSINKNNLFGMNATDSNPYGNGTSFPDVESGINYHADRYLSWGYTDPRSDWRYMGSHVGNKGSGMNVRYASDPFWGEKIAGWYYRFDSANGLKDYNYYTIGIKTDNQVYDVKSTPSGSSKTYYQTKNSNNGIKISNLPFIITGDKSNYYEIKSDTPIINGVAQFSGKYNWNNTYAYVPKTAIKYLNHTSYQHPQNKLVNTWGNYFDTYYYIDTNGSLTVGFKDIAGSKYYFNTSGKMQVGWELIDNHWYYFNTSGVMQIGWQEIGAVKYYFYESGKMATNTTIDGWEIDASGVATPLGGWEYTEGNWYYTNGSGGYETGWKNISGDWYYFNNSGVMQTGWEYIGVDWYYFNSSGRMQTGWQLLDNNWYYFISSGQMATYWKIIDGDYYYFNSSGVMQTGWQYLGVDWYYFNSSGRMQTGWQLLDSNWYYFISSGQMATYWKIIDGDYHYFNNSGVMQTGWQYLGVDWYYFNSSGRMQTGWQYLGVDWYYFNSSGRMQTGWQYIGTDWYHFKSSGQMLIGWQYIGTDWYYFISSGQMLTGRQLIDNKWFTFNANGQLIEF